MNISALAAANLGIARQAADVTRQGTLNQTVVFNSGGYMAVYAIGRVALLVVLGDSGLNLGRLLYETQPVTDRIGGGEWLNLELAAAGNTEVVRSKIRVMSTLALNDSIEDILITLHRQYHLIRLMDAMKTRSSLFLYLVLERESANLVLARHHLKRIETELQV